MKVLLVSSKYPPEYSGSGLRAHNTHLRLRQKYGIETEVVCSSTEFSSRLNYIKDGLKVSRVLSPTLRKTHSMSRGAFLGRVTQAAVFKSEINSLAIFNLFDLDPSIVYGSSFFASKMMIGATGTSGSPWKFCVALWPIASTTSDPLITSPKTA